MMTFPPRASNQKMPLTANGFQPGTLSGLLATLNTAALRRWKSRRAINHQPVAFALQSATQRHLSTPTSRRSEEHTSELQSQSNLVCRLLLEKKNNKHCRLSLTSPPRRSRSEPRASASD